jgi:serpin B
MKTKLLIGLMLAAVVFGAQADKIAGPEKSAADSVVAGNTQFAVRLYHQLSGEEGNLFFSPYSLSTALAMVYGGAAEATETQMRRAMHFGPNDRGFHNAYGGLIERLNQQGQKGRYQLLIANALWAQEDFRFLDSYMELVRTVYDARAERVNYVTAPQKATETINAWVEEKTQGKITDLIAPGALDARTRLVLTNAIYFKGNWAEQFDKRQTHEAPFYISQQDTVQTPMMHRRGEYRYGKFDGLQVLEMSYEGDELSMVIVLPEARQPGAMEQMLSPEALARWTTRLRRQEVDVYLPKFTMTGKFELSKVLAAMGMSLAFTQQADFSGMIGGKDLFISQVVHKAYVDVNEEGTEAAAATGVEMRVTALPMEVPVFRADRPFVFVIKDNGTGAILFMGRMANPAE